MIDAILNGVFSFVYSITSPILIGIDSLFLLVFPQISDIVSMVYTFINTITSCLVFVFDILPISFINILITICDIEILYLGACFTYYGLLRLIRIIKNLNIFG